MSRASKMKYRTAHLALAKANDLCRDCFKRPKGKRTLCVRCLARRRLQRARRKFRTRRLGKIERDAVLKLAGLKDVKGKV